MLNYLQIDELIKYSLIEDMPFGDITTNSIVKNNNYCKVSLISKDNGIICGLDIFKRVFLHLGDIEFKSNYKDGMKISFGEEIGVLYGDAKVILSGERVALNLLQRMSGIASLTNKYANELVDFKAKVVDTRKTTPLYRAIDKYAVLCGGGSNHRYSLSDSILIKDNHIGFAGSIKNAVELARKNSSFVTKIEVETETMEDVFEALKAKADIIMLDNMPPSMTLEMVNLINGNAIVEASGNITLENIKEYGATGVDYISVGSLTHSHSAFDISLKNLSIYSKE